MQRMSDRDYQKMMNGPDVQRVLDQRADAIVSTAQGRTKKVTGGTADSIVKVTAVRDDGVRVRRVGYDLDRDESGPYYEFGTEDTPPHPNLRLAAKSVRGMR